MSVDFEAVKIGDFIEVTDYVANGSFASLKENVEYKESPDYAVLVRLADHNSGWAGDRVYVSKRAYTFLKKSSVLPGDVIISNVGANAGTVFRAPDLGQPMTLGPNSVLLRPKEEKPYATDYIYYFFSSPKGQFLLKSLLSGSAQPKFNKTDLRNAEIDVPIGKDYQFFAEPLLNLDRKIELNRQINQTLEQIAQSIFKSWFVDFEPVKAKIEAKATGRDPERAAMCAISGKSEPELDQLLPEQYQQLAASAALFPDALVESELGVIPQGWEVKSLSDVIEVNPSRTLKKGAIAPYLDMANVPTNSARVADVIQREFSSGSKFMNGDTLLARITPCLENGKTAYVDFLEENQVGWGSTEFIVFRPIAPLPEAYGYLLCRHPDFRAFTIANMSGTSGRQRVPNDCFANYKLAVPSSGVAASFGEMVAGIMDSIKARDEEARTLASLRDILLPKLLSGEPVDQ